MCLADLHDCGEHAECVYRGGCDCVPSSHCRVHCIVSAGPSQFECKCSDGYHGDGKRCVRM